MRVLCSILSLCVLLLSAAPCCTDDRCDEEIASQTSAQDELCAVCSPFLTCGTCVGFICSLHKFNITPLLAPTIQVATPQTLSLSGNCFVKIWQPPKIG